MAIGQILGNETGTEFKQSDPKNASMSCLSAQLINFTWQSLKIKKIEE